MSEAWRAGNQLSYAPKLNIIAAKPFNNEKLILARVLASFIFNTVKGHV